MDNQDIEKFELSFKIIEFKFDGFKLDEDFLNNQKDKYTIDSLQYEFNISLTTDAETNNLLLGLNIKIFADVDKTIEIGEFTSSGIYDIENLDSVLKNYDNKIPNVILANLFGLLISTTRGFMILKLEGTKLEGSILPVINPMTFFSK